MMVNNDRELITMKMGSLSRLLNASVHRAATVREMQQFEKCRNFKQQSIWIEGRVWCGGIAMTIFLQRMCSIDIGK